MTTMTLRRWSWNDCHVPLRGGTLVAVRRHLQSLGEVNGIEAAAGRRRCDGCSRRHRQCPPPHGKAFALVVAERALGAAQLVVIRLKGVSVVIASM